MAAWKGFGVEFSWFEICLLGREVFAGVFKIGKNSPKQQLSTSLADTFPPLVTEITLFPTLL